MSETNKHTPGPWKIQYGGTPDSDGFGIACNNASGPRGIVAECWPPGVLAEDRERIAADAHLIVTAPDLLAFAQLVLEDDTTRLGVKIRAKFWIDKATGAPTPTELPHV